MNALLGRVVAALTVASAAAVLLGPRPLAIAGGLLLAFVLPGMALTDVIFRRRDLTTVERIVLTPALSMGVVILAGLVIYVVGVRIDRTSWTVATAGVTLVSLAGAWLAARRAPAPAPATPAPAPWPAGGHPARPDAGARTARAPHGVGQDATVVISIAEVEDALDAAAQEKAGRRRLVRQLLPLVLVALVLGGAGWLSFTTSRTTHDTTVTALWATPSGPVDAAGNRRVEVSAKGLLPEDGPYTLRVLSAPGTVTQTRSVPVNGDGTWSEVLSMPGAQRMTVNLYRAGDTTAYRTLYISAVD
ncbi:DUF1616 domain-containing protein [Actinoplanes sp. NPDC049118]|uniref:DUF1616 domain-containing protein n=1 Tax=Actinoplanes sp. NPDC049118 TaxID=3155769 RepID=UPI0033E51A1E